MVFDFFDGAAAVGLAQPQSDEQIAALNDGAGNLAPLFVPDPDIVDGFILDGATVGINLRDAGAFKFLERFDELCRLSANLGS
jgi:hypothetical protein